MIRFHFERSYAEIPGYNEEHLGVSNLPMFMEEGRLKEHDYFQGQWWDHVIVSTWRQTWHESMGELLASIR